MTPKYQHLREFFAAFYQDLHKSSLRNALKVGLASGIGILVSRLFHLQNPQWCLITIIVVMSTQIHVGSALERASMRALGTFTGSSIATLTLLCFPDLPDVRFAIMLVVIILFSYLAGKQNSFSYAGSLGAVTTALILFAPNPSVHYALNRFLEIIIGILIAVFVTLFILPSRAYLSYERNIALTLQRLKELYQLLLLSEPTAPKQQSVAKLEETLIQSFAQNRKFMSEFKNEPGQKRFNSKLHIASIDDSLRKLLRAFIDMHGCLMELDHEDLKTLMQLENLGKIQQNILTCLTVLQLGFAERNTLSQYTSLPVVSALTEELGKSNELVLFKKKEVIVNYLQAEMKSIRYIGKLQEILQISS